jgi:hypothetical protein
MSNFIFFINLIRRLQEKVEEKWIKIELVTEFMTTKNMLLLFYNK